MPVNTYGGLSTDTTLGGSNSSDVVIPSQKAIKAYVDNHSGGGGSSFYPNLLDFKWSDHELNDQSWLKADTFSWQDGTVYSDAYNHLVADYSGGTSKTETIGSYTISFVEATDGHRITTDETTVASIYNESGTAWFYVLDTANQRFKLPRINPTREELIQIVRAKGNGKTLGMTDGTQTFGMIHSQSTQYHNFITTVYGEDVGTSGSTQASSANKSIGITTDATKSGIISDMAESTSVFKGNLYLYFYVGQFSQSATEQTAGLNASLFSGKVDLDGGNATFPHIVEFNVSGKSWSKVYSNGWVEQGGYEEVSGSSGTKNVSLPKTMASTDYSIMTTDAQSAIGNGGSSIKSTTLAVDSFDFFWTSKSLVGFYWEVKGMKASS